MSLPRVSSTALVLGAAVLLALEGVARAQNYHYSNGWHPGKRDGVAKEPLFASDTEESCRFRPWVLNFIRKLIMEEISRVERGCYTADTVSNLKSLWEMSARPMNNRRKVGEDDRKW